MKEDLHEDQPTSKRGLIKQASLVALALWPLLVVISLLIPQQPYLSDTLSRSSKEGAQVEGVINYPRGGEVSILSFSEGIATGKARFETQMGNVFSSEDVLKGLVDGDIAHGPIQWTVHWRALLLSAIPVWLSVVCIFWLVHWMRSENEPSAEAS